MKRGPEQSDASRKKLVGEYLRNADRLLKSGEYDQALSEVEKSLELEPGNFYAQAYKERISSLREKHGRPAMPPATAAGAPRGDAGSAPPAHRELTEISGARLEEIEDVDETVPPAATAGTVPAEGVIDAGAAGAEEDGGDLTRRREQIEREQATRESETQRQAEEIARQALEAELRERGEAERLKSLEADAAAEAVAVARAEALIALVAHAEDAFAKAIEAGDADAAHRELSRIRIVDPENAGAEKLSRALAKLDDDRVTAQAGQPTPVSREVALQWYGKMLRAAWAEGKPDRPQSDLLESARKRLNVTPAEENQILPGIQREIVAEAVKAANASGEPDLEARASLERLASENSVPLT